MKSSRFQLFIGVVVLLLATASIAQTAYFQGQLSKQRQCLSAAFSRQNGVLQTRGYYAAQESALIKEAMLAFSNAAEHPEADNQADLIAALLKYKREIEALTEARQSNPVPDFPEGACD